MTKNAYLGPNLAVFGPKLIFCFRDTGHFPGLTPVFGHSRNYGETAVFTFGPKAFFVCTSLPSRGQNMVSLMKWAFFGPENSDPKFC